jgi:hypothetical protein
LHVRFQMRVMSASCPVPRRILVNISVTNFKSTMSGISRVREPAFNTIETNSSGVSTSSYTRSYAKASRKEGSVILSWPNIKAGVGITG